MAIRKWEGAVVEVLLPDKEWFVNMGDEDGEYDFLMKESSDYTPEEREQARLYNGVVSQYLSEKAHTPSSVVQPSWGTMVAAIIVDQCDSAAVDKSIDSGYLEYMLGSYSFRNGGGGPRDTSGNEGEGGKVSRITNLYNAAAGGNDEYQFRSSALTRQENLKKLYKTGTPQHEFGTSDVSGAGGDFKWNVAEPENLKYFNGMTIGGVNSGYLGTLRKKLAAEPATDAQTEAPKAGEVSQPKPDEAKNQQTPENTSQDQKADVQDSYIVHKMQYDPEHFQEVMATSEELS